MKDSDWIKKEVYYDGPGESVSEQETRYLRFQHGLLGILSEIDELVSVKDGDTINLKEELGDFLWYIALMADAYSFTLSDICERNIAKLKARYPEKFDIDRSKEENRNRELERQILEHQKQFGSTNEEGEG